MHVLIVAEADLGSQGSGAERSLVGHVGGLLERGHTVTVVSGGSGAATRDGRLAVERVGWSALTPWRVRTAAERISDVDVVLTYHAFPAWRLVRSPRLRRVPLVYAFLSPWSEEYAVRYPDRHGAFHALGADLRRRVERAVIRRAARVCPMSAFMAGRARAIHGVAPAVIRIVPGGVDVDRFAPTVGAERFRRHLGVGPHAPLLLTLRNLEPRMGVDALLAAMPGVLARHPDARLVVGGTGPLRAELETLAGRLGLDGRVVFPGFIPEDQLAAAYAAADLFVLPTRALEGFGLVTLEALACGTPVLGSRVGATPELLGPLDPGLLLRDTTPDALQAAILAFLARRDRAALTARCRAHAEPYAWTRIAAALEHELLAVRAERRPSTAGASAVRRAVKFRMPCEPSRRRDAARHEAGEANGRASRAAAEHQRCERREASGEISGDGRASRAAAEHQRCERREASGEISETAAPAAAIGGDVLTSPCPVCGGTAGGVLARRTGSRVVRCRACGMAFQDPPASAADVQRYYEHLYVDSGSSGRIDERRRRLFLAFLDGVADAPRRRLLDVGCGTGEFMLLAGTHGWQPSGVDVSPEAVAAAQRLGLHASLGFGGANGTRLPFEDAAFDVVTCWNVVEFFRRPLAELAELARVLAPGGRLFIRTQNETFHLAAYRLGRALGWAPPLARLVRRAWVVHPLMWSPRTLSATLRRVGFDDVRVWNSPTSWGDPYASLGGRDRTLAGVKALVYAAAQLVYALSATRLVVGSSIAVLARRRG